LANLLQRSRTAFSCASFSSFFAFKEGMSDTQISAVLSSPTVTGGFFYCPDEAIDHRDRGQIMLEGGQIIRKITDQRRSAIRTGPSRSDKASYGAHRLALLNEMRTWGVVR
jgi:acetyl-CoA carboxylase carboxyltransferase component